MSPSLYCKVCRSLGITPCPGLSHGRFVSIISISLVVQFSGFFQNFASQISFLEIQYLLQLWVVVHASHLVDSASLVDHHGGLLV
jgi:hypothetical protein